MPTSSAPAYNAIDSTAKASLATPVTISSNVPLGPGVNSTGTSNSPISVNVTSLPALVPPNDT